MGDDGGGGDGARGGWGRPLRVLGLPGWRTSRDVMGFQLGGLQRALRETAVGRASDWAIEPLQPRMAALGPAYPAVEAVFGKGPYFQWWDARKLPDGSTEYDGLEETVAYVFDYIVAHGPFDAVLGFSQGGALLSLLQARLEKDPTLLPTHLHWRCSVYVGAVGVADHRHARVYEDASLGSLIPTVHLIGDKDELRQRCEQVHSHFAHAASDSTMLIRYPEIHQPPTWRNSQEQLMELARILRERCRPALWWAFDFDGVLCDSARETCLSGLRAGKLVLPEVFSDAACSGDAEAELVRAFLQLRPQLEHGFHATVLSFLMLARLGEGEDAGAATAAVSREVREQGYGPALARLAERGVSEDALKAALHEAREAWISSDLDGWLAANDFYAAPVAAVARLCEAGQPVYVITTKHKDFATRLLARAGLPVPADHVFGQGMGAKEAVISDLAAGAEAGRLCVFLEDRVDTLERVSGRLAAPCRFAFASWGYNDDDDADKARRCRFEVLAEQDLDDLVTGALEAASR